MLAAIRWERETEITAFVMVARLEMLHLHVFVKTYHCEASRSPGLRCIVSTIRASEENGVMGYHKAPNGPHSTVASPR